MEDSEDGKEGEGQGGEEADGGSDEGSSYLERFSKKWGWIDSVNSVSETLRISWDDVFNKPLLEFLNVLCYIKDRRTLDEWQQKEWMKKNGR